MLPARSSIAAGDTSSQIEFNKGELNDQLFLDISCLQSEITDKKYYSPCSRVRGSPAPFSSDPGSEGHSTGPKKEKALESQNPVIWGETGTTAPGGKEKSRRRREPGYPDSREGKK
ncbi:hypothetical protein NDU88_003631 [Pleurodeles waltl]|uniref:Uncharacterized protein n=1 Tax=Pleurodeles waltl TaxID=8319 RepID=A0AAV7W7I8_PLEWA|nr:hypothetical protein NDU88_003631 [Pleurodeles waltl]